MSTSNVLRIEVRPRDGVQDARAERVVAQAAAMGLPLKAATTAKVYLIEGLAAETHDALAGGLLADPVTEVAAHGAAKVKKGVCVVEIHPLPGVMDPVAQSVQAAIGELTGERPAVSTAVRYDLSGISAEQAGALARAVLANPVIHRIADEPLLPDSLPTGGEYELALGTVALRGLSDEELVALSREAHLFMSVAELRGVADYFEARDRDPTDIELETLAQTWSEHCVHKTLKSTVVYRESAGASEEEPEPDAKPRARGVNVSFDFTPDGKQTNRSHETHKTHAPGPGAPLARHPRGEDGAVVIDNLLKSTIAAATRELITGGVDWTLSVFKDNSGVIAFDEETAVCIKVETHNHPSALEPYGGAATGIGGCIRDIIGTGLGARPIANTDVFCVAPPGRFTAENAEGAEKTEGKKSGSGSESTPLSAFSAASAVNGLPPGCLPPERILTNVVAGVRDYGNRMGIPTVNGGVFFDERYVGNPLVFCGCVGVLPRDMTAGRAQSGDRIIALGGRTGRDGIHGATFSSAELEHTHADEFSHAVQIGNAIEEKRTLDAILRARDAGPLYTAITDCGAGGFSSAVGEMGSELGAEVHLDRAPLKYSGLSHTEVWISEAQERMVLAVPPDNVEALAAICAEEGVELADLGHFGTENAELALFYQETEVGRLAMDFLHDGIPMPTREAVWDVAAASGDDEGGDHPPVGGALLALLSHPTIASKHWIVRQYDHEVQGNTVVKPLVGPGGRGPGDGAVIEPVAGSTRGIAIACGLQTPLGDPALGGDPYQMALAAIDECVRNLVCVGADPNRIAILDNFCWPSCDSARNMGALTRACEGCYAGAMAYRTPFVSGKDSLNNQLRYTDAASGEARLIEIPYTLLITGLGIVRNTARCVTMDAKKAGNLLVLVGRTTPAMGGSLYSALHARANTAMPGVDLAVGPAAARAVAQMVTDGLVLSAHDCSEGGLLVAVAEMLIATTGTRPGEKASAGGALADLLAAKGSALRPLGADITLDDALLEPQQAAFAETPSRYVLEIKPDDLTRVRTVLRDFGGVFAQPIGKLNDSGRLAWSALELDASVNELAAAWLAPLDW